ncbi:MAG: hypothetical protein HC764_21090 [Pleurocapsa sp. CRU_1_2]|nr:hypothetical protein [Pleurocapsa sp. CRU_1_2]
MMLRLKPDLSTYRLVKRLANSCGLRELKPIPEKWEDFARLCKIRSGAKLVSFEPYRYQIALSDAIDHHPTTVITKTRQLGITETISNKFLHKAVKNGAYLAVVFSKNQQDTSNIAKRLRKIIEAMPEYISLTTDSMTDLTLSNGGRILFRNATANGARGLESVSDILFDEAAFIDEIEEIYKSAIPCTSMVGDDARIIINSTPNGQSGWYFDKLNSFNDNHDVLQLADRIKKREVPGTQIWTDDNGWCKAMLHWYDHPKYGEDLNYLEKVRKRTQLDESTVQQEYNLSFTDGQQLVFPASLVRDVCTGTIDRRVVKDTDYYFGVDVATTGDDYFVCMVIAEKGGKYTIADIYRKRKESSEYHLFKVGGLIDKYKPKSVGIEVTGGAGQIFLEQLALNKPSASIEAIRTTGDTKPAMISRLIMILESGFLLLPNDDAFIQELLAFRRDGKKMQAIQGKHDDIVMSLAFAVQTSPYTGKSLIKLKSRDICDNYDWTNIL